jgi:WD40 repeat protein
MSYNNGELYSSNDLKNYEEVKVVKFSPTNTNLYATGSGSGLLIIWDITSKGPVIQIQAHNSALTALAFCPKFENIICTVGYDSKIAIID